MLRPVDILQIFKIDLSCIKNKSKIRIAIAATTAAVHYNSQS
jgi:hypothetical protein